MSEHDIKVWRESAASPAELDSKTLLKRLVQRSYSHGVIGERRGLDHQNAKRLNSLMLLDWEELLRRLG